MPSPSWNVTTESVGALTDSLLASGYGEQIPTVGSGNSGSPPLHCSVSGH
jgi:hypothetical protein